MRAPACREKLRLLRLAEPCIGMHAGLSPSLVKEGVPCPTAEIDVLGLRLRGLWHCEYLTSEARIQRTTAASRMAEVSFRELATHARWPFAFLLGFHSRTQLRAHREHEQDNPDDGRH